MQNCKTTIARRLLSKKQEIIPDRIDLLKEHILSKQSDISFLSRLCAAINVLESKQENVVEEYEKVLSFIVEHQLRLIHEEAIIDLVTEQILREEESSSPAPTTTTSAVAKTDLPIGTKVKRKKEDGSNC